MGGADEGKLSLPGAALIEAIDMTTEGKSSWNCSFRIMQAVLADVGALGKKMVISSGRVRTRGCVER